MSNEYEESGMTDKQFKAFIRILIGNLENARDSDDPGKKIDKMIKRLEMSL